MMQIFPADLISLCKRGNNKAQRALFDFFYDYMFNICVRYVSEEMLAEDLISQGFTKVFKHIKGFNAEHQNSLRSWIKKIMINECLMWLRMNSNLHLVPIEEAESLAVEETYIAGIESNYILTCIEQLPVGYRTVFNLNVVEGYNHAEIAIMLNIKEATSRSQLSKAKQLLKSKLLEYYNANNYGKG